MNRLIILGNGFDLAHKMPTSYSSFITWYVGRAIKQAFNERFYVYDGLIGVEYFPDRIDNLEIGDIDHFVDFFLDTGYNYWEDSPIVYNGFWGRSPFRIRIDTNFFRKLIVRCRGKRWVDIELFFYNELKKINNFRLKDLNERVDTIEVLNISFEILIDFLNEYLSSLSKPSLIEDYRNIILGPFTTQGSGKSYPEHIHILNLNYTDTVEMYLNETRPKGILSVDVNYLHGKLNDEKHPLIFGFGDELDGSYKDLEDMEEDGYLKFIKSFWYLLNANYSRLSTFVRSNNFELIVLGHSCGLSDRTMFHFIAEKVGRCKAIRLYHHNTTQNKNNFVELTQALSRHFNDNTNLRELVKHFDPQYSMPQQPVQA